MYMDVSRRGVVEDPEVRAALDWFLAVAKDATELSRRIVAAQTFYSENFGVPTSGCPGAAGLLLKSDLIASYLAQVDSYLNRWRSYDVALGAGIIPFFKHIGRGIADLERMPGAQIRARRLLQRNLDHPDGAIFEFVAAVRYAAEDFEVEFIQEGPDQRTDMRIGAGGLEKFMHIECKRLRPSVYELRETLRSRELFRPLETLIHERHLNIHVDVDYKAELATVPSQYLVDRVKSAMNSAIIVPGGHPWSDDYGDGLIRSSGVHRVEADILDSSLLVGSKMARLLCGRPVSEGSYLLAVSGVPRDEDRRYLDTVHYASVLTWQCSAPASTEARARHIRSKLAEVDRQMHAAEMGIVHIGMDAERDVVTADLRRSRNLETVRTFRATSNLIEVNLHYFLSRVAESTTWSIDETVDWNSRLPERLLDDPRMLHGASDIDTAIAAWHLPEPR
jgi:hypothetical protein